MMRSQEPAYTSWLTPLPEHVATPGRES